ncbi:MAG: nucleotidyl transferase AbiEii/AbiGii toxin family protein [Anaerolineae bacterium]
MREYLQACTLEALQRAGAMVPLAFQGGTALRFLYGIPRYSEDLDFSLERERERYDLRRYLEVVRSGLTAEGYTVRLAINDRRTVHSAFIRFPGLLSELALSSQASESLAIKIEVDTNPPLGAGLDVTLVRRHVLLRLQHHDKASLLAGKLHALLQRPYAKGRDVFDLLWYLSDPTWPDPNLVLLNNALEQTGWPGGILEQETWRPAIRQRLMLLPWEHVLNDVRPFLESGDTSLLSKENVLRVLG